MKTMKGNINPTNTRQNTTNSPHTQHSHTCFSCHEKTPPLVLIYNRGRRPNNLRPGNPLAPSFFLLVVDTLNGIS